MTTFKLCAFLFAGLILTISTVYSQSKQVNNPILRHNRQTINNVEKHIDDDFSNIELFENRLSKSILKQDFDSTSVVDSVIVTSLNGRFKKYTYTYDTNGNMTSRLWENWDSSKWVNDRQYSYTYDSSGNRTSYLCEDWDGSQWVNDRQYSFTYDSSGNMTSYLCEDWDGSQWVNDRQYSYTYDSSGNRTSYLYEDWGGSQWVNRRRSTYTYDSSKNMTSLLHEYWEHSQWKISTLTTYTNDANGNWESSLSKYWDGSQWVNDYRETLTYDANGNWESYLRENWDGIKWVNEYRETVTYDANGNRDSYLWENWDDSQWVNEERVTYTFDSNGNMTFGRAEEWENESWVPFDYGHVGFYDSFGRWFNIWGHEITVYYSLITDMSDINVITLDYSLSQNYPNPFNPATTIKYSIPVNSLQSTVGSQKQNKSHSTNHSINQSNGGLVSLKIYDVLGKELATLVNEHQRPGSYEVKWDASGITSGVYFYKLTAGTYSVTKKMLMLK